MSDPLSVAASVAGLISLGITVSQSLVDFYNSYKDLDSDHNGTMTKLESLLEIFRCLEITISNRKFQSDELGLVKTIEGSISKCDKLIHKLQDEWNKVSSEASSDGFKAAMKRVRHRATYPFQKGTLQKMDETIYKIRHIVSFALGVLQLKDTKKIQTDVAEIKTLMDLDKANQISTDIRSWLKAPDATIDHNVACLRKHPGTGSWLIEDARFSKWFLEEDSVLWLNGFAGSGKSVLCSTVIESVLSLRGSDSRVGIAFFYFTFNDDSKQNELGMLRALLLQLSTQLQDGHADLVGLYNSYKTGTPPSHVLIAHLRLLIEKFEHVYIMLDALDESPLHGPRGDVRMYVLDALVTMRQWALQRLHLFVTSRDEEDIRELFDCDLSATQKVAMRDPGIDQDIANFISGRLNTDRSFRKWEKYRDPIQETLARRAKGVFRWVECQLNSLRSCPCSQFHLDRLLKSLPRSLDETYERMLCKIDEDLIADARRILTLLCFAARPLALPELIDGVAVKTTKSIGLDKGSRLAGYNDINLICPGFTTLNVAADQTSTVRIAHFSVQEYLESNRIQHQKAHIFGLHSVVAHAEIAQICLIYLLEPNLSSSVLDQDVLEKFPLAQFAAEYWHVHYESMANPASEIDTLISRLFHQKESLATWLKLHNVEYPWREPDSSYDNPVYYASLLGLDRALYELLNTKQQEEINTRGGKYGTALQAASYKGYKKVLQQLLDKGADTNTQGGEFGNALQAASLWGKQEMVQLLLDRGADINTQGGKYGTALQAASYNGHEKLVQQLLENGADVNAQVGTYGTALQAASYNGHEKLVQQLLENGADVNAQVGTYGTALQAASYNGHEKLVQQLLKNGADVNAQVGTYGTALQAASLEGHKEVVQLLLDRGADINAHGGKHGNALAAASLRGHKEVVQLLLDKGADIDAQGGEYGTALQTASLRGHKEVVQLLLDRGADIDAQGEEYGTALQTASLIRGHKEVVQLLLDRGADINAQGGRHGNALQTASLRGHKEVVRLLLDRGADINARGSKRYGNALQAASYEGREKTVQLLLDRGADINAQGDGEYGNALQTASFWGKQETVQLLLDRGADINARGSKRYGNALQAASYEGREKTVQLLLDRGADINAQGGETFGNALQTASFVGYEKVVQLLLDRGADINAQGGGVDGNALQVASSEGHEKVVQLLLDKGADINAQSDRFFGNALAAALFEGHEKVVQLLLERGADINAQGGEFPGNALAAASFWGKQKMVQLLLDRGADINAQGGLFGNALQTASYQGYKEVVQLLLDKGADINARGGRLGNALEIAQLQGREKVVQLLLDNGAVPEMEDRVENED